MYWYYPSTLVHHESNSVCHVFALPVDIPAVVDDKVVCWDLSYVNMTARRVSLLKHQFPTWIIYFVAHLWISECGLGDDEIGNIAAKFLNEEEHVDTSSLKEENDET